MNIKKEPKHGKFNHLSSYHNKIVQRQIYAKVQAGELTPNHFRNYLKGVRTGGYEAGRQEQWEDNDDQKGIRFA